MTIKYELLKKQVVAAGLKKRWLSSTTEELLENRRKQNAKSRIVFALIPGALVGLLIVLVR